MSTHKERLMRMQHVAGLADGGVIDVVFRKYVDDQMIVAVFPYAVCCKKERKKAVCHAYSYKHSFPTIKHATLNWYAKNTVAVSKKERVPWVKKLVAQHPKVKFNIIEEADMDRYTTLAKMNEALREIRR